MVGQSECREPLRYDAHGVAVEHAALLRLDADLHVRGPLTWLTLMPTGGRSTHLERNRLVWSSHLGERIAVAWPEGPSAARVRVLEDGRLSLALSEPMPRWVAIGRPEAVEGVSARTV